MEPILEKVTELYQSFSDEPLVSIDKIPQSGSDRSYFRLNGAESSVIATFGNNIRENETFIYFSNHFKSMGCPVPRILVVSEDRRAYLQEDFGDVSLLNCLEKYGYTEEVYALFQQSLKSLAQLQVKGNLNKMHAV